MIFLANFFKGGKKIAKKDSSVNKCFYFLKEVLMKKAKIILSIILIIFTVLVFCSCKDNSKDLPTGGSHGGPSSPWYANYEIKDEAYDIDEVKISCNIERSYMEIVEKIDWINVYVQIFKDNSNIRIGNDVIIDKTEELTKAEDNSCFELGEIIVPREAFTLNYGNLVISCSLTATCANTVGKYVEKDDGFVIEEVKELYTEESGTNIDRIYYRVDGDKVYLSEEKPKNTPKPQFTQYANCPISVGYERQKNKDDAVDFLAINSENRLFDIKNASVNLSIGRLFNKAEELPTVYLAIYKPGTYYSFSSETGEVWPSKDYVGDLYEINGYGKEKYGCRTLSNEDGIVDIEYKHIEKFILPEKLFDNQNETHLLEIKLFAEYPNKMDTTILAETFLNFYVCDGKVYIF